MAQSAVKREERGRAGRKKDRWGGRGRRRGGDVQGKGGRGRERGVKGMEWERKERCGACVTWWLVRRTATCWDNLNQSQTAEALGMSTLTQSQSWKLYIWLTQTQSWKLYIWCNAQLSYNISTRISITDLLQHTNKFWESPVQLVQNSVYQFSGTIRIQIENLLDIQLKNLWWTRF